MAAATLNTNLNENECAVLYALVEVFNGDFGFTDEITVEGIDKAQHSGYVTSLVNKGWVNCFTGDPEWVNGFEITPKAIAHLNLY